MLNSVTQRPLVHGIPLQQSALVVHCWPYSAQNGTVASAGPASCPGLPGGGVGRPQMPWVEPCGTMHITPTQQSPLIVQGPPDGTQVEGTPPSMVEPGGR